jgi:acyl-CoA thioesterase I
MEHRLLLRYKHDLHLTGNGLNHPNDFGQRVHAQAILALLMPAPITPAPK